MTTPALSVTRKLLAACAAAWSMLGMAQPAQPLLRPTVALFYGLKPPIAKLDAFDIVVVDPDADFSPLFSPLKQAPRGNTRHAHQTRWFAYVSVGEVHPDRSYYASIPPAWRPAQNDDWASDIIDQSQPDWPAFFVDRIITPLWQKGYRGFFLDTLDSFQRISKTDAQRDIQQAGLVRVITEIKKKYPDATLIFNRGFEILPRVHQWVSLVAFESFYQGWNASAKQYVEVPEASRDWLRGQLVVVKQQYKLPIVAIDYCPENDDKCRIETSARLVSEGFIPYITDSALSTVGTGQILQSKP